MSEKNPAAPSLASAGSVYRTTPFLFESSAQCTPIVQSNPERRYAVGSVQQVTEFVIVQVSLGGAVSATR